VPASTRWIAVFATAGTMTLSASPAFAGTPSPAAEVEAVTVQARFAPPNAFLPSDAVTYDLAQVPAAAHVSAVAATGADGTWITLGLRGMLPERTYGAHVHESGCGTEPAASGVHLQHVPDPVQPSVDPAYANPVNEIWLDVTTDALGTGVATATSGWRIPRGGARSIVLHEHGTSAAPGHAGVAGARVACVNLPLEGRPMLRPAQDAAVAYHSDLTLTPEPAPGEAPKDFGWVAYAPPPGTAPAPAPDAPVGFAAVDQGGRPEGTVNWFAYAPLSNAVHEVHDVPAVRQLEDLTVLGG
jgi:Cu-Zn family superoxide dismutase